MVLSTHTRSQRGIALITAMLMLLLLLSLALGFALLATGEQISNGVDLDHTQAFYSAYGAMEQLNAAVGTLFSSTYAPTGAAINALVATPPTLPGMTFFDPFGGSGYEITYPRDAFGNPQSTTGLITQGQYQGFQGQITDYTITISVQSQNYSLTTGAAGTAGTTNRYGSEVRLRRSLQTVSIPVFQFGIFSQTDLSFFPGPNFSFGGVVATNGNLYLASGNTLTLSAQTSAYGDVIRDRLSNGYTGSAYQASYPGTVNQSTAPGTSSVRALAFTEGSINGGPSGGCPITGTGTPNAGWTTISVSNYNSALRDGAFGCSRGTGAKNLQLPLVNAGASGIDLIKLPPANENTANCAVFVQRYFTYPLEADCASSAQTRYAMLRIMVADTPQEIMALPQVSAGRPIPLFCKPASPAGNPCSSLTDVNYTGVQVQGFGTPALPGTFTGSGEPLNLPPWAASAGNPSSANNTGDWFAQGQPRLWGYVKMEYQDGSSGGSWTDVTQDILSLGTTGRNLSNGWLVPNGGATGGGAADTCKEPYPNAVLRFQRLTDVPASNAPCGYTNPTGGGSGPNPNTAISSTASDYIPLMLFDPREALLRDVATAGTGPTGVGSNLVLSGVMHYVELDVTNLSKWFLGTIGKKGAAPASVAGYLVYFSDRRSNQPCAPVGTNCPTTASASGQRKMGNLGYEDFVNSASSTGTPNGTVDTGEDLNGANATAPGATPVSMPLDTYGGTAMFGVYPLTGTQTSSPYQMPFAPANENCTPGTPVAPDILCPGNTTKLYTTSGGTSPYTAVSVAEARDNPAMFFRRALKLTDAQAYSLGNCGAGIPCGLTITSENPVYIEGNYNATGGSCSGSPIVCTYTGTEAPSAVLADAMTLLSVKWNDINSYISPWDAVDGACPGSPCSARQGATTYYRTAVLAGKGVSFPTPSAACAASCGIGQDFGTDGGVHNFLRYLENWSGNLAYSGSIVSFYFNTQATGTYKCCAAVYNPPGRGYAFDTNFLTPALLPPRTPAFRDINTLGFTQLILPSQQ
jgi:hypothetical protein